jgi:nucleotide-binding universal stress UspA family protein
MASQPKLSCVAINRILLATDFSPESENAFSCALSVANRFGSSLFLAHVLTSEDLLLGEAMDSPACLDVMRQNAEKSMTRLRNNRQLHSINHDVIIRSGKPCDVITKLVTEENIDLIVMGTHGDAAIKKLFLGSTAECVIRDSRCPVLTVGPHLALTSFEHFKHILYATAFSAGSSRALNYALLLAEQDRSYLTLLHAIESPPAEWEIEVTEWIREDREKLRQMIPLNVDLAYEPEIEVETGVPAVEILRLGDTRKADLIVMGSHVGGAMATHLPWTTLHDVLRNARCPVLTVCAR